MDNRLTIGKLAALTDVPPKTIRYYEEAGVLPPPQRSESRYRLYSEADVRRLELVRRARLLDMSLLEVRELVVWASSEACHDFQHRFLEVVRRKLDEVDKRITDLSHLKHVLRRMEAHFIAAEKEVDTDHTVLECSPETCTCLGGNRENQEKGREVTLWLDKPESKKK